MRTLLVLSASFLFLACSSTSATHQESSRQAVRAGSAAAPGQASPFPLFPAANGELVLEWGEGESAPSVLELVKRYGELTGQSIVFDPRHPNETKQLLESQRIPLDRGTRVAARDVQTFVEALLAGSVMWSPGPTEQPRTLFVYSLKAPSRSYVRESTVQITSDQIESARVHPAVMFTTVIELPDTDVRMLSNSMRSMIIDPNLMTLVPAGTGSLLLTAPGTQLADIAKQLFAVDAAQNSPGPATVYEFIRLQKAEAQQIGPLANEAFPDATIRPYAPENALLIICREHEWPALKRLVAQLDAE